MLEPDSEKNGWMLWCVWVWWIAAKNRSAQWLKMLMVMGFRLEIKILFLGDRAFRCYSCRDPRFCTLKTKYTNVFSAAEIQPRWLSCSRRCSPHVACSNGKQGVPAYCLRGALSSAGRARSHLARVERSKSAAFHACAHGDEHKSRCEKFGLLNLIISEFLKHKKQLFLTR